MTPDPSADPEIEHEVDEPRRPSVVERLGDMIAVLARTSGASPVGARRW